MQDIAVGVAKLKEQMANPMFVTKGGVGYGALPATTIHWLEDAKASGFVQEHLRKWVLPFEDQILMDSLPFVYI